MNRPRGQGDSLLPVAPELDWAGPARNLSMRGFPGLDLRGVSGLRLVRSLVASPDLAGHVHGQGLLSARGLTGWLVSMLSGS